MHMFHNLFKRDMTRAKTKLIQKKRLIYMLHDSLICGISHSDVMCLIHILHNLFKRDMARVKTKLVQEKNFICDMSRVRWRWVEDTWVL